MKHPVLFGRLRTGFLLFSVLWLGLYAKAQLSVVNVFTFANAVFTGFRWENFLLEPLIFMLWCSAAVSLLFWGRGAYCGWLCPFGALQELLNHAARRLGIRQVQRAVLSARAPVGFKIYPLSRSLRRLARKHGVCRAARRDRAVQDGGAPALRARVALRDLRLRASHRRALHRALLLPLPLRPRRGARDPWPRTHVRLAQAPQAMRLRVPALRQELHGPGDPSARPDQSQRMPLLHALPGHLLG